MFYHNIYIIIYSLTGVPRTQRPRALRRREPEAARVPGAQHSRGIGAGQSIIRMIQVD